jgi:chemosensory pili system protein ChpA (sensor histidine kinase/response regulator)
MPAQDGFTEEELQVLRPLFVSSGREHIERALRALEALGRDPGDAEQLELLHRSFHSLKGAAMQFGVLHLGVLAQAVEAVARSARGAGCLATPAIADLLAEGGRQLAAYLDAFEQGAGVPAPPAELMSRLQEAACAAGGPGASDRAAEG